MYESNLRRWLSLQDVLFRCSDDILRKEGLVRNDRKIAS